MGEDASLLRTHNAPQALAVLCNVLLSLFRFDGWSLFPDAFHFFARHLPKSLLFIGALSS